MPRIMGLDLGTSSLKVLWMSPEAEVLSVHAVPYPSLTPHPGWMEQDPAVYGKILKQAVSLAMAEAGDEEIAAISLSGHMSGVVLVDAAGEPVCHCLTLSDARSDAQSQEISRLAGERIFQSTGNPVLNAFAAPKLKWIAQCWPEAMAKAAWYLAPKDYLRYLLCGELRAEYTDAANSLLLDRTGQWDFPLIGELGLPQRIFPPILRPDEVAGHVTEAAARQFGLPAGVPVVAGGADMACGAVGTGLLAVGDAAVTLGTSATFLCVVAGPGPVGRGAVTYHPHAIEGRYYALGSHFNGGLALNWLSSLLSPAGDIDFALLGELADRARALPPTGGLLTLPFLIGSGSPYFEAEDSGAILGLTQVTDRAALLRSMEEGIAFNLRQTLLLFEEICGGQLSDVRIAGGGLKVAGWAQVIADVFGRDAHTITCPDASTVGAAILAGHGVGLFPDMGEAARRSLEVRERLSPDAKAHAIYRRVCALWEEAHDMLQGILGEMKALAAEAATK